MPPTIYAMPDNGGPAEQGALDQAGATTVAYALPDPSLSLETTSGLGLIEHATTELLAIATVDTVRA